MNDKLTKAINKVTDEWCSGCNHKPIEENCCIFEEFKEHCAIANLLNILNEEEKKE